LQTPGFQASAGPFTLAHDDLAGPLGQSATDLGLDGAQRCVRALGDFALTQAVKID
jgi:hypothetical protein